MKFLSLILIVLPISGLFAHPAAAAAPWTDVLPRNARVLASENIPGRQALAVTYANKGDYLGVVSDASGARLIWTRQLPGKPDALQSPGPAGLFRAVATNKQGEKVVFAYLLHGSRVNSAIAGHAAGHVAGPENVRVFRNGFELWTKDAAPISVSYRFVVSYRWRSGSYRETSAVRVPDYPPGQEPVPSAAVKTAQGDVILIKLEVARTEAEQEQGLMYRKSLDSESGMIFVFDSLVLESFWMENTYIPLSVAFLGASGKIQEIQDMAPLTTDAHTPQEPYQYAIEVNQGFFAKNGIQVGDTFKLQLGS